MADDRDEGLGSVSGLPDELGIDDGLAELRSAGNRTWSADQRATGQVESRRYGKPMTIVEKLDPGAIDLKELASGLKRALAVGGTVEDGRIELQGDHAKRVPDLLREEGFEVA